MPKILVAGENSFLIYSFTHEELEKTKISHTRNASVLAIGSALDNYSSDSDRKELDIIKPDLIMLLKQSETWKKAHHNKDMDGFSLLVFRAKNQNAKKSYIATWCGQSQSEMLSQNPEALIKQLVTGFSQLFNAKDYHKKSIIHHLMKDES